MRKLNVFFDVDDTLIVGNGLRNHAREVFERLAEAGHSIYVWSGVGIRKRQMVYHGLDQFVKGYYVKPLWDYKNRLAVLDIPVMPDFVVDDHYELVKGFDGFGYTIPYPCGDDDRSLMEALAAIEALASRPSP